MKSKQSGVANEIHTKNDKVINIFIFINYKFNYKRKLLNKLKLYQTLMGIAPIY